MEDVRFFGGQYGIWTRTPSPGWQFTAVDLYFEGQTEAAIRETAAGLTLIRPHFRTSRRPSPSTPAITTNSGSRTGGWRTSAGPAVIISLEENPRTEINMENVVCRRVPTFALLRDSGKTFAAPAEIYEARGVLSRAALRGHRRGAGDQDRVRDGRPDDDARTGDVRPRAAAASRHVGEHPHRSAPRATASPTTRPSSARRSPRTAPSTCRSGLLRDQRHADAQARHGADRPAPARHRRSCCSTGPRPSRASARPSR